jgi:hypothetical protein
MAKTCCKKDKFHQIDTDRFKCDRCAQTANDKEKVCKPSKQ